MACSNHVKSFNIDTVLYHCVYKYLLVLQPSLSVYRLFDNLHLINLYTLIVSNVHTQLRKYCSLQSNFYTVSYPAHEISYILKPENYRN